MSERAGEAWNIDTQLLDAAGPDVNEKAGGLLIDGYLVVFPTDTVYGVAAAIRNTKALNALYKAKERPLSKGIPVLIADMSNLEDIVTTIPDVVRPLIKRYWPGPLTLILPKRPDLPAVLSPNEGVAVRLPDNDIAREIIAAAGGALAVSSANLTGGIPACSAQEAYHALGGRVSLIIDAGPSPGGTASTVINCLEIPPRLERQGPLAISEIERYMARKP